MYIVHQPEVCSASFLIFVFVLCYDSYANVTKLYNIKLPLAGNEGLAGSTGGV